MRSLGKAILAGAIALIVSGASGLAADLPPPPIHYKPPKIKVGHTWYLRGAIAMTNQQVGDLDNLLFEDTDQLVIHDKNFESGVAFEVGVGIRHSDKLRFDLTAEYRGETGFHGFDTWVDSNDDERFNNYTAKKSEWLFLANGYWDIGSWHKLTPYLGAGIGVSRNTIHSFRDAGIEKTTFLPTMAYADAASTWNFAWALHAGVGIRATKNLTVDIGYSYVDLGSARSGDIIKFDGGNDYDNPMYFNDITSHDFKIGVRYELGAGYEKHHYDYPPPPIVKY